MRLEYPCWSSGCFDPETICFEQDVSGDDELSHDCGDSDLCGFSGFDELTIFGLEVGIEAGSDESGHVEGLPDIGSPASDEALAFPLTRLARDGSEAGEAGGLFVLERSEFGMVAMSWLAVSVPTPSMLVRIWWCRARPGSDAMSVAISASRASM